LKTNTRLDWFLRAQLDVVTRWNSTYHAWNRMVALKPYIEMLQSSLPLEDERDVIANYKRLKTIMITEAEWTPIVDLIAILKPFDDVTKYVSSGMHPTMSIGYPTIVAL